VANVTVFATPAGTNGLLLLLRASLSIHVSSAGTCRASRAQASAATSAVSFRPRTKASARLKRRTVGATLSAEELLRLSPENLARRLYSQEILNHQATLAPRFACRCSRERIGRMLVSLGREEVDSIIAELATVTVTCDFCGREYAFDAVDVAQVFASGETIEADARLQH